MSTLFSLNWRDILDSVGSGVISAMITGAAQLINFPGFSFLTFDWTLVLKIGLSAFLGILLKRLTSDEQGSFLGIGTALKARMIAKRK